MMQQDYTKLRKHPRVDVDFTIEYAIIEDGNLPHRDDFQTAKVVDISAGGMRLNISKPIGINSRLLIFFSIPGLSGALTGEVVRFSVKEDDTYDIGISFVMLDTQRLVYDRLVAYINHTLSQTTPVMTT